MSRQLQRKLEKRIKKSDKKLVLTPANTGLTPLQLSQLEELIKSAENLYNAGRLEPAEKLCRLILKIYPGYADAFHMLGGIATIKKKYARALEFYERAVAIAPDHRAILNNYGLGLKHVDRAADALKCFNKSLRLKSDCAETLTNKGSVLVVLGQIDDAIDCYAKAIKISPEFGKPYYNLAGAHKFEEGDEYSRLFEKIEPKIDSLPEIDRMNMNFAFGKYYESIKDYKKGFSYFLEANRIRRASIDFDIEELEKSFSIVRSALPEGKEWCSQTDVGSSSDVPIFILGMPRSGTTLTEQILASHPKVFGAGELKITSKAIAGLNFKDELFFPTDPEKRKVFAEEIAGRGDYFVKKMREYCSTTDHITDKMPQNFRYVGALHLMLPNAKIIHCKRNPVDTCLSNFRILFGDAMDYTYSLEELGRFYVAYCRQMEHWNKVLPGRFLDVQYEDVVSDVETQARRIIAHCGLEWDDACLDFHKTKRAVQTASVIQVRQPIYNSSVGRWEKYGELLDPLLKALEPVL